MASACYDARIPPNLCPEGKLMEAFVALAECAVVCCATVIAAWVDAKTRTIPDACPLAIMCVHVCAAAVRICGGEDPAECIAASTAGALAALVPLLVAAYVFGGIGGGDIKLLSALGFVLGWQRILAVIFLSCVFTVLAGLIAYLARRLAKIQSRFLATQLPMAPEICIAVFSVLWVFPL